MEHGVPNYKRSPEALRAKRERERSQIKEYLVLTDDVLSRRRKKDWGSEALDLTSKVLQVNPEFATVWNYRRNIFLNGIFPNSSPHKVNELLGQDLEMTTRALKAHPKVYSIWNHRRWCLQHIPDEPNEEWKKASWDRELFVVERMLEADSRNFHAWSYRRYVLASMPVRRSEISELAYTRKMIEANFSNFSAWHQRSKVLSILWSSGQMDSMKSKEEEFELVRNAMYTDPDDQSVWLYHRWLVGSGDSLNTLEREIESIQELLDEQPDSRWCMESLVHYKQLIVKNHSSSLTSETGDKLIASCVEHLRQLESIDPLRRQRYYELASNSQTDNRY